MPLPMVLSAPDTAPVGADDLVRQSKAETGAFAGLLCGEERLEDVLHRLLVHAAAGVGDAQADVA